MKYAMFLVVILLLTIPVYAGPDDKWVYVGNTWSQIDWIALLLAIGAFAWAYVVYRDARTTKPGNRKK